MNNKQTDFLFILFLIILIWLIVSSCNAIDYKNPDWHITTKEKAEADNTCRYSCKNLENYFYDSCSKYNVGDTLLHK